MWDKGQEKNRQNACSNEVSITVRKTENDARCLHAFQRKIKQGEGRGDDEVRCFRDLDGIEANHTDVRGGGGGERFQQREPASIKAGRDIRSAESYED